MMGKILSDMYTYNCSSNNTGLDCMGLLRHGFFFFSGVYAVLHDQGLVESAVDVERWRQTQRKHKQSNACRNGGHTRLNMGFDWMEEWSL